MKQHVNYYVMSWVCAQSSQPVGFDPVLLSHEWLKRGTDRSLWLSSGREHSSQDLVLQQGQQGRSHPVQPSESSTQDIWEVYAEPAD